MVCGGTLPHGSLWGLEFWTLGKSVVTLWTPLPSHEPVSLVDRESAKGQSFTSGSFSQ